MRTLSILMLQTRFPRPPGDIGHPASFDFPVRRRVVQGSSPQRVVRDADPALLQPFIDAARALVEEVAAAIATSCGFLARWQRELQSALPVPVFIKPEQEELPKTFFDHWAENDRRAYRESLKAIVNWDVEARLGEIDCPVLVVASDEDYLPLEEKRAYTTSLRAGKLVVIEDARHAVTAERPEELNRAVNEFLTEITGARA